MYIINKTLIEDCFELVPDIFKDNRGISIKPFNSGEFEKIGVNHGFAEDLMVTSRKGVLRGLHFQKPPFEQAKLIWCIKGSIFDVAVDIRKNSPSFGKYICFDISSDKHNLVYIPAGFAHGYQVLEDETIVYYKMSNIYSPKHEGGIRFDSIDISWPLENPILSDKDMNLAQLRYLDEFLNYINML